MTGIPYAEVIGDPIAHSKSPVIHKIWLDKLGIEADYRLFHVKPDELKEYISVRRDDPDSRAGKTGRNLHFQDLLHAR